MRVYVSLHRKWRKLSLLFDSKPFCNIHHYTSSRPWESLRLFFGAWSQACWQERCPEIYYNQIRLWSELKKDVKNGVQVECGLSYTFEGHLGLRALSVGRDYPPCCFSARFCSAAQWAEHGTSRAVVRGLDSHCGSSNWNCMFAKYWKTNNKMYPLNCLWCIWTLWGE